MDIYKITGSNVRLERKKKGWTQERLAEKVFVSPQHISQIENGKTNYSLKLLADIALALDVKPQMLLEQEQEQGDRADEQFKRISYILKDCCDSEMKFICSAVFTLKRLLRERED